MSRKNAPRQQGEYGNYKGYYSRKRPAMAERFVGFENSWFDNKSVLDVGSAEGVLSLYVGKTYRLRSLLGVEKDPLLFESACAALKRERFGLKKPAPPPRTISTSASSSSSCFLPRAIGLKKSEHVEGAAAAATITTLKATASPPSYPFNIEFACQDIMERWRQGDERYDVTLCFSVTKWIHLHGGDEGLNQLFENLIALTKPGGLLIIEYQPWKSYENNKNANETTKINFKNLRIKPEDFEAHLTSESFGLQIIAKLGTCLEEAKGFSRPILVLRKPHEQDGDESFSMSSMRKRKRLVLDTRRFATTTGMEAEDEEEEEEEGKVAIEKIEEEEKGTAQEVEIAREKDEEEDEEEEEEKKKKKKKKKRKRED